MSKAGMSDEQAQRWGRTRGAAGALRFIVFRGVVMWGMSTALLFACLTQLIGVGHQSFIDRLSSSMVAFPLAGIVWGAAMWLLAEDSYKKWQRSTSARHDDAS